MFDISLNLTKYIILWGAAFLVGFLTTLLISYVFYKRVNPGSILLAVVVGIILFVMTMYGFFNPLLNYLV